MKLLGLRCGDLLTDAGALYGTAPSGLTAAVPIMTFVLDTVDGLLVFDTGCSPECAHAGYMGPISALFTLQGDATTSIVARLAQAGYARDDVRWVTNSHLHFDHAGMNGAFPAAQQLTRARELNHARARLPKPAGFLAGDLAAIADSAWDYDEMFDLLGDGRVRLVDTSGHTPGHQALVTRFADGHRAAAVGDAVYSLDAIETGVPQGRPADREAAVATIGKLAAWRDAGVDIYTSHDLDQWRDVSDIVELASD